MSLSWLQLCYDQKFTMASESLTIRNGTGVYMLQICPVSTPNPSPSFQPNNIDRKNTSVQQAKYGFHVTVWGKDEGEEFGLGGLPFEKVFSNDCLAAVIGSRRKREYHSMVLIDDNYSCDLIIVPKDLEELLNTLSAINTILSALKPYRETSMRSCGPSLESKYLSCSIDGRIPRLMVRFFRNILYFFTHNIDLISNLITTKIQILFNSVRFFRNILYFFTHNIDLIFQFNNHKNTE